MGARRKRVRLAELSSYRYKFPENLVAQQPASPRDSARLLVCSRSTKSRIFTTFSELEKYLPPRSVLVFNDSRVLPARFVVRKATGGKVVLLLLRRKGKVAEVISDRKLEVDTELTLATDVKLRITGQSGPVWSVRILGTALAFENFLSKLGQMPLPPYIRRSPLSATRLKQEYQTVFAKNSGSAAAPTAGLHFTHRLLAKLRRAGHEIVFVTLHVGLGTFASLTAEQLKTGRLHREAFFVTPRAAVVLTRAKKQGRPIVAVGTTALRTLESAWNGKQMRVAGETELFIRPGYKFKFVDGLITNFHVPESSLLMLVSAFLGKQQTKDAYRDAINHNMRLFSFGDGMLIH